LFAYGEPGGVSPENAGQSSSGHARWRIVLALKSHSYKKIMQMNLFRNHGSRAVRGDPEDFQSVLPKNSTGKINRPKAIGERGSNDPHGLITYRFDRMNRNCRLKA
jgi:hypothetical protein